MSNLDTVRDYLDEAETNASNAMSSIEDVESTLDDIESDYATIGDVVDDLDGVMNDFFEFEDGEAYEDWGALGIFIHSEEFAEYRGGRLYEDIAKLIDKLEKIKCDLEDIL